MVNDGSTDETGALIDNEAGAQQWIRAVHRADRGFRQAGRGVMEAFYEGYQLIEKENWEYIVKLDGDLTFNKDYFERCLEKFARDPRLGIGGGTICNEVDGRLVVESSVDPKFHVRGATKIYRRECWKSIGGLVRETGWDTLDEVKANMLGWRTATFDDIPVIHHRPAGQAYGSWRNLHKNGRANYVAAYHPLFMLMKCASRLFQRPYVIGGCALWAGFITGYMKQLPQVNDPELIRYFRTQQMNRLLKRRSLWDDKNELS
jgi:hypothetical protein